MEKLGVVVIGMGIAGKARVRDLIAYKDIPEMKNVQLIGYVTRQELEIEGAKRLLDDPFTRADVHIIIISTENERHEELARKALCAKKHVLVDYPLGRSFPVVEQLHQLAKENNVICQEESLSLLLDSTHIIKDHLKEKELEIAYYKFTASLSHAWISDFKASGSPFICNINLFHTLLEWFSDLTPVMSSIIQTEGKGFKATAEMRTSCNKPVHLSIERAEGLSRGKSINFKFTDGSILDEMPPYKPSTPGLFFKDFLLFMEMVNGNTELYKQWSERTLKATRLADEFTQLA
ncbi:biliverdin reductase A-like [Tubulanus polymorphus]|uniref:biliverdin reductase A-like n=1 Tax=Tubulanus polymorphus TaxID=672921 RepID=UPI003DA57F47